jgi:tyrosinase
MMALRETNELSYYQLAGIHGLPHIPWGQPASDDQDTDYGYCTHASGLFATWHRPYLSLIEQRIVAHAISEAKKFQGADKQRYLAAAKRVRIPYWDWAVDNSAIPAIVKQPMISVIRPGKYGRNGTKTERVNINNPLYSYRFTDAALKNEYFSGFYIQAPETLRQPTDAYTSHDDVADTTMQRNYAARRQNTYNLFSIPSFAEFSSTAFSAGGVPNAWTSVESIHNQVHGSLGGTTPGLQGHMALVDYSSFDPIFWLHHAQVDRLAAMYQAVFPGRVVTAQPATGVFARKIKDGDMDTIDTPLWPFKKPNGQYYTSRDFSDAGSIWQYGYEYPEIPASYQGREKELVSFTSGQINALYSPSATVAKKREEAANSTRTEWLCHFVFIPAEVGATAMLEIYLDGEDFTTVDSNSTTDDGYVGAGAALGRMTYTEHDKRMRITATVPLTYKLEEDKIDINDPAAVVKYLKDNLRWSMQKVCLPPLLPPLEQELIISLRAKMKPTTSPRFPRSRSVSPPRR